MNHQELYESLMHLAVETTKNANTNPKPVLQIVDDGVTNPENTSGGKR